MPTVTAPAPSPAVPLVADKANRTERAPRDLPAKVAGFAAIWFVLSVIGHNIARGASAPANDASAAEVLTYYTEHRTLTAVLVATFVLNAASLAVFLGVTVRRMLAGARPASAITGLVGATAVVAMFSLVVASEQALWVVAGLDQPDLGAVQTLWAMHNSIFTVLCLALAIALFGLGRAGVAAGLTPRPFEVVAPVGAVLLTSAAFAGPAVAAGDAMPAFGLSGLGFLCWLAFLLATGQRLVRGEGAAR
jgi:hypothetical protein